MPIPLVALGAAAAGAWLALRSASGSDTADDAGPAQDIVGGTGVDTTEQTVSSTEQPASMPTNLSAMTLTWRAELIAQAPDIDIDVLLRWIQRESDGNPAAVGSLAQLQRDGWAREAGIGQVFFENRTQRVFGVTSEDLRSGAAPGTQMLARDLTAEERFSHTSSLITMCRQYVSDGQAILSSIGVSWTEQDIYCLAKLKHALPVLSRSFLITAGAVAQDWDSYRAWLESLTVDQSLPMYAGSAIYYPWTRYLNNAQYAGRGG